MAAEYQRIALLAKDTAKRIVKNEQEWTQYLTTASRLYKYPFDDQMLIYAQRPNATACATLEIWNKISCWVNRGAKGIALLDNSNNYKKLKYIFDVSDVHTIGNGQTPYLWKLREDHKDVILAQLEKTYGINTNAAMPFEKRLIELEKHVAQGYYKELYLQLRHLKE